MELHVKINGLWQCKGTGSKEELTIRAAKYQEIGYKTRVVKAA
jgi:hypothetical protein